MERGHAASVQAMLKLAIPQLNGTFSAIDLGCGNGWVTRMLTQLEQVTARVSTARMK